MRFLLRFLLGIVTFIAVLGMIGSGGLWAYGQYGVPLVEQEITQLEDQFAAQIESDNPGSDATVDIQEIYYKLEGTSLVIALKTHASADVGGVTVQEETVYATIDVLGMIQGNASPETYQEGAEWDAVKAPYKIAPEILFNQQEAQSTAITYGIISAAAFVGSIVIKAVFLRRKRH